MAGVLDVEGQFHEPVGRNRVWWEDRENPAEVSAFASWAWASAVKAGEVFKAVWKKVEEVSKAGWEKVKVVMGMVFDDDSTSTQDWDVGLAQTIMVVSFSGVAGLGALKIQGTGYEIKLPVTPLIIGFGLAFTAASLTILLEERYPRAGKVFGKLGLVATATTFSAMVIGLLK